MNQKGTRNVNRMRQANPKLNCPVCKSILYRTLDQNKETRYWRGFKWIKKEFKLIIYTETYCR